MEVKFKAKAKTEKKKAENHANVNRPRMCNHVSKNSHFSVVVVAAAL